VRLIIEKLHYHRGNFSLRTPHFALGESVIALLAGESGCGKSTFLKLCSGILKPESGSIHLIPKVSPALMLQNPLYQVISSKVYDELAFPLQNMQLSAREIEARIQEAAALWQIDALLGRNLHSLSLGELQKVMLAVTLIMKRPLTLLDEPSSHLDSNSIARLYQILGQETKRGHSFIIASQNLFELHFCDELILMGRGEIAGHYKREEKALYKEKLSEWGLLFEKGDCSDN